MKKCTKCKLFKPLNEFWKGNGKDSLTYWCCVCLKEATKKCRQVDRSNVIKSRTIKRFWDKIEKTDFCWNWIGCKSRGYGILTNDYDPISAHRLSYEMAKGKIPDGLQIDHLCRNRACVNPDHLEIVSYAENIRRGLATKLTKKEIKRIRTLYRKGRVSQHQLAFKYGVHQCNISRIVNMRRWTAV